MLQKEIYEKKEQFTDDEEFVFPKEIEFAPEIEEYNQSYNEDNKDLKIEQYLRETYKNEINSFDTFPDDIIVRFVIGYRRISDYDQRLQETDKLFRNYLKWHRDSNFDDVLQTTHINEVDINEYIKGSYVYGQDRFGHPLFWDDGLKTVKNADNSIHFECKEEGMDVVTCYFARIMHEIKVATKQHYKLKVGGYQHSIILNMKNFSFMQALKDRKMHEFYASRFSELAPEALNKMYIINAPWIFQKAWAIISCVLHPNTVEKTKIMGSNYMEELLKQIDINMIPKKFGGRGRWQIKYGSVPKGYPIQI